MITSEITIPEGFKLMPNRSANPYRKRQLFAISEKGQLFDVNYQTILVPADGETTITVVDESPGHRYEAHFDIPTLVAIYFGQGNEGLSQKDFDELVAVSSLPAHLCRAMLDDGWAFEKSTDAPGHWIKISRKETL